MAISRPRCSGFARGLTLTELLIASAIGAVLMAVAWTLFRSSSLAGKKSQDLADSVQSASLVLQALNEDWANRVPGSAIVVGAPEDPNLQTLQFTRLDPAAPIQLNSPEHEGEKVLQVSYRAERHPITQLFSLTRVVNQDPKTARTFVNLRAREVRFFRLQSPMRALAVLRVSLLVVQEDDSVERTAAQKSKPLLLSKLYVITPRVGHPAQS